MYDPRIVLSYSFFFLGVSTLCSPPFSLLYSPSTRSLLNSHISHIPFALCQRMPVDDDLDYLSSHPCSGLP